jgi:hypothetical protein|tara:strand:+ start:946 stop:1206 length:261 start_codon:yes stop_codon:yes gene_type:complete
MFREWKMIKGTEYVQPIPFDGEDVPRETKKTHNDKGIDHVQAGLKADTLWNERPLNECAELALLIREQFDDDTSNVKSEVIPCQII